MYAKDAERAAFLCDGPLTCVGTKQVIIIAVHFLIVVYSH